ncbi:MAG TPA: ankyrin repeat domain-containing protein [Tepidisphaeraceae bacterium]
MRTILSWGVLVAMVIALVVAARYGSRIRRWATGAPDADDLLLEAAWHGDAKSFEQAVAVGASAQCTDRFGNTPLIAAALRGDTDMADRLLAMGADVNAQGAHGYTPLMWAVTTDRAATVALLIRRGADPRLRSHSGQSAADIAKSMDPPDAKAILAELDDDHRRCD